MDDTLTCPICENRLRTVSINNKFLHPINKTATYAERTCNGLNHVLQFFADEATHKIDFIKISLNPKYTKYLEIDFINTKCRISCMKKGKAEYIEIPKMIEPDFPHLVKLKERVALYVVFS